MIKIIACNLKDILRSRNPRVTARPPFDAQKYYGHFAVLWVDIQRLARELELIYRSNQNLRYYFDTAKVFFQDISFSSEPYGCRHSLSETEQQGRHFEVLNSEIQRQTKKLQLFIDFDECRFICVSIIRSTNISGPPWPTLQSLSPLQIMFIRSFLFHNKLYVALPKLDTDFAHFGPLDKEISSLQNANFFKISKIIKNTLP